MTAEPGKRKCSCFCLPRQKRFFRAFWAKNGQNTVKSGFGAGDQPLRSPIFCVQAPETGNNAGVLFAFLCSVKKEQKGVGGGTRILTQFVYFAVNQILHINFQKELDVGAVSTNKQNTKRLSKCYKRQAKNQKLPYPVRHIHLSRYPGRRIPALRSRGYGWK